MPGRHEERIRRGRRRYLYIDVAYARAVERAGGVAVHLPIQKTSRELVDRIDGLLLPGGDDFLPDTPYPDDIASTPRPPSRSRLRPLRCSRALERELPVLGICYGAQLIALHHGGTLHYHLPLDRPESDGSPARQRRCHPRDSHRARIAGWRRCWDRRRHLGQQPPPPGRRDARASGMRVCARSLDGVVEAIERESGAFASGSSGIPRSSPAPAPKRSSGLS